MMTTKSIHFDLGEKKYKRLLANCMTRVSDRSKRGDILVIKSRHKKSGAESWHRKHPPEILVDIYN